MNAIMGMTDIASAHIDTPEKVQDCLRKISLSSQHLLGLINDVLDMSKIESGKMTLAEEVIELPEVMDTIVSIMQSSVKARQQQFDVRLRHIRHEQLCCDSLRLRQVLINVLSNASKLRRRVVPSVSISKKRRQKMRPKPGSNLQSGIPASESSRSF